MTKGDKSPFILRGPLGLFTEVGLEELEGFNRIHNVHDWVSKILLNPSNSSNPTSKNRLY
jgi:hypothetical protein